MKIKIRSEGKKIFIPIPNFLMTSKFILKKISKHLDIEGISSENIRNFQKVFRKVRKQFKGLLLVDVESSSGEIVKIYL